ncbi:ABC-type multidrug transport system, ATPase component [Bellilinea caldifistulae]|uniref:ABC transporter ATPase n=1 Tax=Bellilinea caldifistulae TaxID=360411 RepID=A0A0P6XUN5_9CHLR|nr:ABC transporter ATP-binding protein [Bellilinea caldifistulae]KPL77140.1 ABC transporter ATPase [Bellilinea caldifistulae]GAP10096.1 ABC-type multidrug transport system, ATPase component [Bellilinea caldifistulae]
MSFNDTLVIETKGLEKSFGNVKVLQGVDLSVKQNSIFGFLGPNGAGKTTTMKILLGLIRPTGGSGSIFGRDIVQESVAIRERIGYLPQQPRFIEYMSARENLEFTAAFFYTGPKSKIRMRCDEMLELVGLTDKAERPIRTFSGGEKQRLGIALAQVNYPDLLILDEPASALDPLGRQEVLEIMQRLRKHTSIFYSTHILDDVQRVSDSVAILNHGKVVASGPIELILNGQGSIIYCMTIKGEPEGLGEKLANLPWVTHTSVSQHNGSSLWQISVNDEVEAETNLLRYVLADEMITVTEFNRKKYELEEVFMEVIKGDGNGR